MNRSQNVLKIVGNNGFQNGFFPKYSPLQVKLANVKMESILDWIFRQEDMLRSLTILRSDTNTIAIEVEPKISAC